MIGDIWLFLKGIERETWAVFVAALALALTIWQGYESRKHNKLSMRPIVNFSSNTAYTENEYSILLENKGFGPALVKEVSLFYKGEFVGDLDKRETWEKLNYKLPQRFKMKYHVYFGGVTLSPNEKSIILLIEYNSKELIENEIKVFNDIDLYVEYESLYEEKFSARRFELEK